MACNFPATQAIVVGGGLGGMAAANTVLELGGRVTLLDKSSFCGGNSTKATSGINGAGTKTQKDKGIPDTADIFVADTLKGGAKKPELVDVLCRNSGADVEWLMNEFDLDLSLVARLGGHSQPRTHRGAERFPGMTITYALIQMVEKVSERNPHLAKIVTKACVDKLLTSGGKVVGCSYTKGGMFFQEHGPVILATGGFGADFSQQGLLAKFRPDLLHLPTTNGEHCTGDGIKMGEEVGGATIDLNWVQVHPTGLVKPDDPDAKVKFLAAEALRGVGGVLLDATGNRFANELGRRDYVTGEMWKSKAPFRLCLNTKASKEIHWHCEHYKGRGVMRFFESGKALAKEMGVEPSVIEATLKDYNEVGAKMEAGATDGPFDAYPSGKSWDKWGKKFFHNLPVELSDSFHVAIVTPVIHYCMGGLEIDTDSAVVDKNGKAVPGLYAAGEVAGGVHGSNRLGGNSLLDCVVFGRVAGVKAVEYMYGADCKATSLVALAGGRLSDPAPAPAAKAAAAPAGGSAAPAAAASGVAQYTMEEVAKHTSKTDCWVVLAGKVLNVTEFLKDHPGGELAILTFAGKDATAEFDMIHPPDVVGKYAPDAIIGVVGTGGGSAPAAAGGAAPAAVGPKTIADEHAFGGWRDEALEGGYFRGYLMAAYEMVWAFLRELLMTIFSTVNIKITGDRKGLTRSAIFLIFFMVIHAVGNLHVFLGPDDFNGYGYFYVRLYWSGFGFDANIVEEYVLLAAVLHAMVGLRRTWDISINYPLSSGKLNLAISGVTLLVFMVIHLFQFRFGQAAPFKVRPPPYMINLSELPHLFYTSDPAVQPVEVRDIYRLEYEVFSDSRWVAYYIFSTLVFTTHFILGWMKVVPAPDLAIPRKYQPKVTLYGILIALLVCCCYLSFPLYAHYVAPSKGELGPF